jgi:hypothetical protein
MDIENVTLGKMAVAGLLFDSLTTYNTSLSAFRSATADSLDLAAKDHRQVMLKWLNAWGCRHLSKDYHGDASNSIKDWYSSNCAALLTDDTPLWQLEDQEIGTAASAYGSLKDRLGAWRYRHGSWSEVSIGPTATSKILFALRPKALMPWDEAMRKHFGYSGSAGSYSEYLTAIKNLTLHIGDLCMKKGLHIDDLPRRLRRPNSTVLELVNEYIWVTVTSEIELPSSETLAQWASLG